MERRISSISVREHCKIASDHCVYSVCMVTKLYNKQGWNERRARMTISGQIINNLRYVDDTLLIAGTAENLRRLIAKVKQESSAAALKLNTKKTIFIMTNEFIQEFYVVNERLEIVKVFAFLGSSVNIEVAAVPK